MKYGGVLQQPVEVTTFALCPTCETVFQDATGKIGSVACPNNCGSALVRGLSREEAKEQLNDEHKELLS